MRRVLPHASGSTASATPPATTSCLRCRRHNPSLLPRQSRGTAAVNAMRRLGERRYGAAGQESSTGDTGGTHARGDAPSARLAAARSPRLRPTQHDPQRWIVVQHVVVDWVLVAQRDPPALAGPPGWPRPAPHARPRGCPRSSRQSDRPARSPRSVSPSSRAPASEVITPSPKLVTNARRLQRTNRHPNCMLCATATRCGGQAGARACGTRGRRRCVTWSFGPADDRNER